MNSFSFVNRTIEILYYVKYVQTFFLWQVTAAHFYSS